MFRSILFASVLLSACGTPSDEGDGPKDGGTLTDTATVTTDPTPTETTSTGTTPTDPTGTVLTAAELVGTWSSPGCEAYPDGAGGTNYLTRTFTLTEDRWALEFTIFGDAACTFPLFRGEVEGPYTLGAPSAVAGATEGEFGIVSNQWTALFEDLAVLFEDSGCGTGSWEVGVPQDVTVTGCIGVAKPVADCPTEYDIVSLDGDSLYFGERVTDMCVEAGRPAALVTYPVVRQ